MCRRSRDHSMCRMSCQYFMEQWDMQWLWWGSHCAMDLSACYCPAGAHCRLLHHESSHHSESKANSSSGNDCRSCSRIGAKCCHFGIDDSNQALRCRCLGLIWCFRTFQSFKSKVKWPNSFQQASDSSKIFLLDVENLAFSCFVKGRASSRYLSTTLVFPAGIMWLLCCFLMSKLGCGKMREWSMSNTKNTMGHVFQVGFSSMSLGQRSAHLQ